MPQVTRGVVTTQRDRLGLQILALVFVFVLTLGGRRPDRQRQEGEDGKGDANAFHDLS
jgi:hypothetical protein